MRPSTSKSSSRENEAFVRCIFQFPTVEDRNTMLQNRISSPKAEKRRFWGIFWKEVEKENMENEKRQNHQKSQNFAAKVAFASLRPPLQCDLQLAAEKHKSIAHAAATMRNRAAALPLRSANNALQNTIE